MSKKSVLGVALMVGFVGVAHATIQFPFASWKPWYICKGYNAGGQTDPHHGNPVLDFSTDPDSPSDGGCAGSTKEAASGQPVLAPIAGKVAWFRSDMLCITSNDQQHSIGLGHLDPAQSHVGNGVTVSVGDQLGIVASPNDGNNGYSHIHIQGHNVPNCQGNLTPFVGDMRFEGASDLPYDGSPNQWARKKPYMRRNENGIPYPIATLIRVSGENDVFLIAVEDRESVENPSRIVKRLITSPTVFDLNKLHWTHIVEITAQDKAFYLRGGDITGKIVTDGLTEGELIRLDGSPKVYVASNGQLHWLNMTADEFLLLGYSFSLVRNTSVSYPKGKEIRYAAFTSSLPPLVSSPPPGVNLSRTVVPNTDPRYFGLDPLTVFYYDPSDPMRRPTILVGYDGGIRAFTYDASFLWETHDAWGNMELDGDRVYAFGSVPEYVNNISTGFS